MTKQTSHIEPVKRAPAPLWRRVAAILYDTFLIISVLMFVGLINLLIQLSLFGSEQLQTMIESGYALGGPLFNTIIALCIPGFFAFFWTRSGQTLGMKAWKIQIVNQHGQTITLQQSMVRSATFIPAVLLLGAGVIWCLWDGQKRSWQDILSGTETVLVTDSQAAR